jgi:hypothetical protein
MKLRLIFVVLLSLCAAAMARPNPVGPDEQTLSLAEAAVIEPQSAALTRPPDHFRAPHARPIRDKNFSCRRALMFSAKPIRLARSCP